MGGHRHCNYMKLRNFMEFSGRLPDVSTFDLYTKFINTDEKLFAY